jgi:hypothetical protein
MAKYRHAELMADQDMTSGAGTHVLNLDIDKPISRITVRFETHRVNESEAIGFPANIPKIELVDGSTVLHSLTGFENQALAYYSRPPGCVMDIGLHIVTLHMINFFALDFGRHLWDEMLAFEAKRFSNPQLKITYNEALCDTGAGENLLGISAEIFDEKPISPIGFLMPVEHYAYTAGAVNSYEQLDLPADRPIRQILVRAHQDGHEPYYCIQAIRMDEGTLDRIPFEETDLERYFYRMMGTWPKIITDFYAGITNGGSRTFYLPQTNYQASIAGIPIAGADAPYHTAAGNPAGGKFALTGSADKQWVGVAEGYLPWHTFQFPMGKLDQIDDWYDPTGKKPRLRIRAGGAATNPTVQVVLEELYKY